MDLHALYDRLPAPLRDVAAGARGLQLARTRYGPDTERLVAEAVERESWGPAQWQAWREERLEHVLHRAATRVPWYRDHWDARRRRGDRASPTDLANWPILTKAELRAAPEAFVADDRPIRRLVADHTSGTTGTPLTLWFHRDEVRQWYALFEARARRWHGVDRHDEVGMLGGQLVVPTATERPPYWVANRPMHQLYLSTHHIRADRAADYARALDRHGVRYLLGYTSALTALARALRDAGVAAPQVEVAITNAEPCTDQDRREVSDVFGGLVRVTYGMAEVVAAAVECPHGTLHDFPEVGWLEHHPDSVRRDDEPAGVGDVLATGLVNASQPLVRYQVGDRLALPAPVGCPCGRGLPGIAHVSGRSDDVVHTPDGRTVGRLDHVFKADLPVLEAQIVQEALDRIRVLVVPAPGWSEATAREVADRTRERIGDVQVDVEVVDAVPRSPNGKFRAVVSHLPRPT
jgi:phenylacetate-CoA ligase